MPVPDGSIDVVHEHMRRLLARVVPEIELRYKAELVVEINRLKRERRAVILGHNYMEPALYHTVPDHVGDSLELSRVAAGTDAAVIVFCGVRFMAETAKILSPDRVVLLPSLEAGCSLAGAVCADDVRALRAAYPGAPVVSYVNTYADVKAESDACCTSSNATAVVESFKSDVVIMIPDEYLTRNTARDTGRRAIFPRAGGDGAADAPSRPRERVMIGWPGRCEVHERFTVADIVNVRAQVPGVTVLSHPECSPEVVAASDFSGSTSAMIRHVRDSRASRFLLLTECCMGDNVAVENPDKEMVRLCSIRCPHMNTITLEDTLAALREMRHVVELPTAVRERAARALHRMIR